MPMKPYGRNLTVALGALLLMQDAAGAAASGSGKTYRWVDKNGVVHIGDNVPPEYASQGKSELNSQGVPVRETPRQRSPEEEAAARQAEAELSRRRQRDSFLLSTYTKASEIEQLRDERLALLEGQMDIARSSMGATDQRLAGLRDRMRNFAPYSDAPNARRLPDQLAQEVISALKEQRALSEILVARESEKKELRAQFDADIARYRELAARPASR